MTPSRPSVLARCAPDFSARCDQLSADASRAGVPIRWVDGYRTWEEQGRRYRQGRATAGVILDPGLIVTLARAGHSWHNYGLAADFAFDAPADPGDPRWTRVGQLGKALGLVWGGQWPRYPDVRHMEWHPGLSLVDAQGYYIQGTLADVWQAIRLRGAADG